MEIFSMLFDKQNIEWLLDEHRNGKAEMFSFVVQHLLIGFHFNWNGNRYRCYVAASFEHCVFWLSQNRIIFITEAHSWFATRQRVEKVTNVEWFQNGKSESVGKSKANDSSNKSHVCVSVCLCATKENSTRKSFAHSQAFKARRDAPQSHWNSVEICVLLCLWHNTTNDTHEAIRNQEKEKKKIGHLKNYYFHQAQL